MYSIKSIKKFKDLAGATGFQGALHKSDENIAIWSHDINGNQVRIEFVNRTEEAVFVSFAKSYLSDKKSPSGKPYSISSMTDAALKEIMLHTLVQRFEEDRVLLKHAKKGLAFYVVDPQQPSGKALYVAKTTPYTPQTVAALRERRKDLLEVVNERLGLPFDDPVVYKRATEDRYYRRRCQRKTYFSVRTPSGAIENMRMDRRFYPEDAAELHLKFPNIVEIYNERFL